MSSCQSFRSNLLKHQLILGYTCSPSHPKNRIPTNNKQKYKYSNEIISTVPVNNTAFVESTECMGIYLYTPTSSTRLSFRLFLG